MVYEHDFHEAIKALMSGRFIQGDNFMPGYYVGLEQGVATVFNVETHQQRPLVITTGIYAQKYMIFVCVTEIMQHLKPKRLAAVLSALN